MTRYRIRIYSRFPRTASERKTFCLFDKTQLYRSRSSAMIDARRERENFIGSSFFVTVRKA